MDSTFSFQVECSDAPLNAPTSGPFQVTAGAALRIWSAGGILSVVKPGSALVEIEPNILSSGSGAPTVAPKDPTRPAIYVDSSSGFLYFYDPRVGNGSWQFKADPNKGLTGPQGPPGLQGSLGSAGSVGPAGPPGVSGSAGAQGFQGTQGFQGAVGPQGNTFANLGGFTATAQVLCGVNGGIMRAKNSNACHILISVA